MTRIDLARASDIGSGVPSGTAFPGSPSSGDLFWRTDRGLMYFYDGTRWLTSNLYRESFSVANGVNAFSASGNAGRMTPWHTTYDLWLDTFYVSYYVATTLSGTAYWTVECVKVNAANVATNIATTSSQSESANTWITKAVAIGALLDSATYKAFRFDVTKVSTPGNITITAALAYRLVG